MSETVYIHYGHGTYVTPDPIRNRDYLFTKPIGGLWASRKDTDYGWKQWCEQEEFRLDTFDTYFEFTLKDKARILVIRHEDQLDNLPKLQPYDKDDAYSECYLDFEELKKQYDVIEFFEDYRLHWRLYGWDCDSILVMNPDVVEILQEEIV